MGDNKTKTKAAMLDELESIKDLLLEEDDIPILQEVIEHKHAPEIKAPKASAQEPRTTPKITPDVKTVFEEQQDFFNSPTADMSKALPADHDKELLDTLGELEKHTAEVTANKFSADNNKIGNRTSSLAKATGENPF